VKSIYAAVAFRPCVIDNRKSSALSTNACQYTYKLGGNVVWGWSPHTPALQIQHMVCIQTLRRPDQTPSAHASTHTRSTKHPLTYIVRALQEVP
jgi:hypothetical protein